MNVLVYDGPGVSSLQKPLIATLKALLSSYYDVIPINHTDLNTSPWEESTSLLVIGGGRDLLYLSSLQNGGIDKIRRYIENGGNYLGICAGAYFASSRVEFELDRPEYKVIGDRPFQFCPAIAFGSITKNFTYGSELGAKAMSIIDQHNQSIMTYCNGAPGFQFDQIIPNNVTVLASYAESKVPAIVDCKFGKGCAILTGPHLELSSDYIKEQADVLKSQGKNQDADILNEMVQPLSSTEESKNNLFRFILKSFKLKLNENNVSNDIPKKSTIWISCLDSNDLEYIKMQFQSKTVDTDEQGNLILVDEMNTWIISNTLDMNHQYDGTNLKQFISFYNQHQSIEHLNPLKFNIIKYQEYLKSHCDDIPQIGSTLLYSDTIGSTQTSFDKNPKFSSIFPSGTVFVASEQTAGRGRGKNSWISQQGCLMFSLRIIHSHPNSIIFLQYLFGLAVVEAIKSLPNCSNFPIHLKWPNDIYVKLGEELKKVGAFHLTIGCGLNVLNSKPSICLQDLISDTLSKELLLSKILTTFQDLYQELTYNINSNEKDVFQPFRDRYYQHWLHTNQIVQVRDEVDTLKSYTIRGIDESGFLKVKSTDGLNTILSLQPDGNSFDMLKNLIYVKE
ncbi:biotin holocarboxylase synthetase [Globomyces sp. JEL0801]|nr:biotin holocarboxylase synthetase [Globomyces sp. JEL0801]